MQYSRLEKDKLILSDFVFFDHVRMRIASNHNDASVEVDAGSEPPGDDVVRCEDFKLVAKGVDATKESPTKRQNLILIGQEEREVSKRDEGQGKILRVLCARFKRYFIDASS